MFGVKDLDTGIVMDDETYSLKEYGLESTLDLYIRRYPRVKNIRAVPKDYINWWPSGHKCEHDGCFDDGSVECCVPDESYHDIDRPATEFIEYLCCDHAFKSGYCVCCGEFWGGIEDFDFGNGLCDNCKSACDLEYGEYEADIECLYGESENEAPIR